MPAINIREVLDDLAKEKRHILVIIDPISTCLPESADPNQETHVRPYMEYLSTWCCDEKYSRTIIGINPPRKAASHMAESALGAIAWSTVPRVVMRAERLDSISSYGYVGHVVNNLSKSQRPLKYKLTDGLPEVDTEPGEMTMERIVAETAGDTSETDDAVTLITAMLEKGSARAAQLMESARQNGITPSAMKRGKSRMGLVSKRIADADKPYWAWVDPVAGESVDE